jgi:hypothetical protein
MTIELADKRPPLSDIHPMRALYLIPTADSKTLMVQSPRDWDKNMIAFISNCLVKDARKRPSADEILTQPFMEKYEAIGNTERSKIIVNLIKTAAEEKRRRTQGPTKRQSVAVPQFQDEVDSDEEVNEFEAFEEQQPKPQQPQQQQALAQHGQQQKMHIAAVPDAKMTAPTVSISAAVDVFKSNGSTPPESTSSSKSSSSMLNPIKSGLMNIFRIRSKTNEDNKVIFEDSDNLPELVDITNDKGATGQGNDKEPTKLNVPSVESNKSSAASSPAPEKKDQVTDLINKNQFALVSLRISDPSLPYQLVPLDISLKGEILCADSLRFYALDVKGTRMLFHFMLLGTEKGLIVADITHHQNFKDGTYQYPAGSQRCRILFKNTRVRQLQVLEDYCVCLALAGKSNQIRAYQLSSLRKLIRFVFGLGTPKGEENDGDDEERLAPNHEEEDVPETPSFWAQDFEKVYGTKDTQLFTITRTRATIYLGAIMKNSVTVYEWAKLPYLKFMKVKDFWVPETPKSMDILHNGKIVTDLIFVYDREANYIEFESSQVKEIAVSQDIQQKLAKDVQKDKDQMKWFSWIQLNDEPPQSADNPSSIPTWYNTMKSMKPGQQNAQRDPRFFLATYGNQTRVVDEYGELKSEGIPLKIQPSIEWNHAQSDKKKDEGLQQAAINRLILLNSFYAAGIHKNFVEICNLQTGKLIQTIKSTAGLRVLCPPPGSDNGERRRGKLFVSSYNKKKKASQIYWLKETGYDLNRFEKEMSKNDKIQKSNKVLGTGTVLKGNYSNTDAAA